nr:glutathione S-transferase T3-like [Tanacetum cinerariifolium]
SKWHTLNANCQKFNAAYKRAKRLGKSGENDVNLMKRAQRIYRDEHKGVAFCQEDAWAILKFHPKWDAPKQVDLTGDVPGATQEDLFGHDARPRPAGKPRPAKKTKIRRHGEHRAFKAQSEKDRTLMRLEELRFLATSTKDLDDDDAYWIKNQRSRRFDVLLNEGSISSALVPSEVVPSEVSPLAPQLSARIWFSFDYFGAPMLLTPDLNHPSIVQLSPKYCSSIGCLYHKYLRRSKLIVTASFRWSGGLLQKSAPDVCSRARGDIPHQHVIRITLRLCLATSVLERLEATSDKRARAESKTGGGGEEGSHGC